MKAVRSIVVALVLFVVAYPAVLAYQVWDESHTDEPRPAEAIVVLGAAQYDGEPSPVFKARLDHAAYLYGDGLSETIIVAGGKREGDRFTEAQVGTSYLVANDIPSGAIVNESEGRTTLESLSGVSAIARERDIDSVLLVSDPLHSERVKRMAHDLGFEAAYTSPASYAELNRSRGQKVEELAHEVAALLAYELLGR